MGSSTHLVSLQLEHLGCEERAARTPHVNTASQVLSSPLLLKHVKVTVSSIDIRITVQIFLSH